MRVKDSFFIYLLVCFIGSIFCWVHSPNFPPIRRQYYIFHPSHEEDQVGSTAKCDAIGLTLASVNDIQFQDQQILLDVLREDYSRFGFGGPSEFWLSRPYGPNLLTPPYTSGRECVKLVFIPNNIELVYDNCGTRHRMICIRNEYGPRSLLQTIKTKTKKAFTSVRDFAKWVKSLATSAVKNTLVKTTATTVEEVGKQIMKDILAGAEGSWDSEARSACKDITGADSIAVLEECAKAIAESMSK